VFVVQTAVYVVTVVDVELSITGSNVGTAVKAEQAVVNVEDTLRRPTDCSRPPSKWCTFNVSECYYTVSVCQNGHSNQWI